MSSLRFIFVCLGFVILIDVSEGRYRDHYKPSEKSSLFKRLQEILRISESQDHEEKPSERVIGGTETLSDEEQPWLVRLEGSKGWFSSSYYCGGSLISDNCVLSAAHCFDELRSANKWEARLASRKRSGGILDKIGDFFGKITGKKEWQEFDIDIARLTVHPKYRPGASDLWENDIAVLVLEESVPSGKEFSQIRAISLPEQGERTWPADGQDCLMLGWGCDKKGASVVDKTMKVTLPKLKDADCTNTWGVSSRRRLCAGYHYKNKGICPGDSGGPLICSRNGQLTQAGIASFTSANQPGQKPGAFTRVSAYSDWIKKTCGLSK